MILLMAGYILYQTSLVMSYFPPTAYVAASLMLFCDHRDAVLVRARSLMMQLDSRR